MMYDPVDAPTAAPAQPVRGPVIPAAWGTRRAPGHEVNEDSLATGDDMPPEVLDRRGRLYVVSDGMGGHAAGEEASRLTVAMVRTSYYDAPAEAPHEQALVAAIEAASAAVHAQARSGATEGMGATVVAALVLDGDVTLAHVGDSRAYLVRGRLARQLTRDHTLVAELVRRGSLPAERLATHPMRHALSQHIGQADGVKVDVSRVRLRPSDQLILTTDGVSDVMGPEPLRRAVRGMMPSAAVAAILDAVAEHGQEDDATAVVIGPLRTAGDRQLSRGAVVAAGVLAVLVAAGGIGWVAMNGQSGDRRGAADASTMAPSNTSAVLVVTSATKELNLALESPPSGNTAKTRTCAPPTGDAALDRSREWLALDYDHNGIVDIVDWCSVNCPDHELPPTDRDRFNRTWYELCKTIPPVSKCEECRRP